MQKKIREQAQKTTTTQTTISLFQAQYLKAVSQNRNISAYQRLVPLPLQFL